jgi:hypothetical protein
VSAALSRQNEAVAGRWASSIPSKQAASATIWDDARHKRTMVSLKPSHIIEIEDLTRCCGRLANGKLPAFEPDRGENRFCRTQTNDPPLRGFVAERRSSERHAGNPTA